MSKKLKQGDVDEKEAAGGLWLLTEDIKSWKQFGVVRRAMHGRRRARKYMREKGITRGD